MCCSHFCANHIQSLMVKAKPAVQCAPVDTVMSLACPLVPTSLVKSSSNNILLGIYTAFRMSEDFQYQRPVADSQEGKQREINLSNFCIKYFYFVGLCLFLCLSERKVIQGCSKTHLFQVKCKFLSRDGGGWMDG